MSKKKKPQNKKKNQSAKPAQNDAVLSANVNETMASETGETSVAVEAEKTIQETKPTENVQNTKKEDKKADKNQKNTKNAKGKNAKKKEKGKVKRKVKETFAELEKVTWPSFGDVCKKTGTVLVVVLIFAVIIYGIDYCLGLLMNLLH